MEHTINHRTIQHLARFPHQTRTLPLERSTWQCSRFTWIHMARRDEFKSMIQLVRARRVRVLTDVRRQTRLTRRPYGCPIAIAPSECPSRPGPDDMWTCAKRTLRLRLRYAKCHVHRPRAPTCADLSDIFCAKVGRYNMYDPSRRRSRVSGAIRKSRCPARRSTRLRFSLWSPLRVVVVRPRTYVSMYGGTRASESPQIRHRTRRAGPEHALLHVSCYMSVVT